MFWGVYIRSMLLVANSSERIFTFSDCFRPEAWSTMNAPLPRRNANSFKILVGGLEHVLFFLIFPCGLEHVLIFHMFPCFIIFPYIGNVIIPIDYIMFFREVGIPPTRICLAFCQRAGLWPLGLIDCSFLCPGISGIGFPWNRSLEALTAPYQYLEEVNLGYRSNFILWYYLWFI